MSSILAVVLGSTLVALLGFIALVYMAFIRPPMLWPGGTSAQGAALACVGDSLTHATLSGDYVTPLRTDLAARGIPVLNFGQNGDTSKATLKRIHKIIRARPRFVTIMIGVNDVLRGCSDGLAENLTEMVVRLRGSGTSHIALISISPLGENLADETNESVLACNRMIEQLAARLGVDYLSIGETLTAKIRAAQSANGHVTNHAFKFPLGRLFWSAVQHYVLRRSFDDIGRRGGLTVHADQVHLTDRSADLIRSSIREWVTSATELRPQ
jgi:acyl-CoA thioesterase-1